MCVEFIYRKSTTRIELRKKREFAEGCKGVDFS